jgi:hypothetical protein
MSSHRSAAARPPCTLLVPPVVLLLATVAACATSSPTPTPTGSGLPSVSPSGAVSATPQPTLAPTATPQPTPLFTNPPDPELAALIPIRLGGVTVQVPPPAEFAYTPGDVAEAYGELGLRFTALQVAYVQEPRLSLYAMRISEPYPTTRQLEPYLETAGQYVGIAGLQREPWRYRRIGDRVSWVRPEDNATAAGTMIYTWSGEDFVFLLIGVDDRLNRAMFAALPGEERTDTAGASASPQASASP